MAPLDGERRAAVVPPQPQQCRPTTTTTTTRPRLSDARRAAWPHHRPQRTFRFAFLFAAVASPVSGTQLR